MSAARRRLCTQSSKNLFRPELLGAARGPTHAKPARGAHDHEPRYTFFYPRARRVARLPKVDVATPSDAVGASHYLVDRGHSRPSNQRRSDGADLVDLCRA